MIKADAYLENGHSLIQSGSPNSTSPSYNQENGLNGSYSSSSSVNNGSTGLPANPTLSVNRPSPNIDYLTLLIKDKKQLSAFPNVFTQLERLLDDEINRVRVSIFQCEFTREPLQLPDAIGEVTVKQEKVFVPVKEYPEYNFVGRILGPRGMTAKQLEAETGCKIMVRGKGSMRDKKKEEMNRGKANWEHLSEDLHVLIQCEDTPNRIEVKMMRAVEEVRKLLVPAPEGEDDLKKKQLMELAIINGTYRNGAPQTAAAQLAAAAALTGMGGKAGSLLQLAPAISLPSAIRSPGLAGAPLIMQPARQNGMAAANAATAASQAALLQQLGLSGANLLATAPAAATALVQPATTAAADYQQLLLSSMQYDHNALATLHQQQQIAAMLQAQAAQGGAVLADYNGVDLSGAGAIVSHHRRLNARDHPYTLPVKRDH